MNKTITSANNFGKKLYAKPELKVVEIKQTEIICTSNSSMYEYELGEGGFEELL